MKTYTLSMCLCLAAGSAFAHAQPIARIAPLPTLVSAGTLGVIAEQPQEGLLDPCIDFQTEHNPPATTLHARISNCGCDWIVSTPRGREHTYGIIYNGTNHVDHDSDGVVDPGEVYDLWEICCETIDPNKTVEIVSYNATIAEWDINGDGRFNQADIDAIGLVIADCTSPSIFDCMNEAVDVDGDGDIDSDDTDILQDLIDCGLDTGVFGDANGDGEVTCADESATTVFPLASAPFGSSPYISVHIGDPGYQLELDYDLNGVLNATDQAAFNALFAACP